MSEWLYLIRNLHVAFSFLAIIYYILFVHFPRLEHRLYTWIGKALVKDINKAILSRNCPFLVNLMVDWFKVGWENGFGNGGCQGSRALVLHYVFDIPGVQLEYYGFNVKESGLWIKAMVYGIDDIGMVEMLVAMDEYGSRKVLKAILMAENENDDDDDLEMGMFCV